MDILVAILTSSNATKLKRCVESVLPQTTNVVIVCNTLDFLYVEEAKTVADNYNIDFIVTESNGNPGKGKNSVKDYFLSTEFSYLIPVDGDDYLLPGAIEKIQNIVNTKGADVIGLVDGQVLLDETLMRSKDWQVHPVLMQRSIDHTDPKKLKRLNLHIEKIRRVATEHDNFFNRFVLLSRKAAECINYEEDLTGAEDIKQGLLFKLLHKDGILNYIILSSDNVYVYDVTDMGACFAVCKTDLPTESKNFWNGLTDEMINNLRSFQLELLYD